MKIPPEVFDILGVFAFSSITAIAIYALITGNSLPQWVLFYLLFVGIAGLIIDGTIVYIMFLRKRND